MSRGCSIVPLAKGPKYVGQNPATAMTAISALALM
jgi:hypothetical protein